MARLSTDLWVHAYLKRLELANIPAYVTARGQASSGSVLVKCARLDGTAQSYERRIDLRTGTSAWMLLHDGPEREVDEGIRKQRGFDPDLWVMEIESRSGETLLEEEGLSD